MSDAWAKQHDLATMRQALAKLTDAITLVEGASLGLDDIPAEILCQTEGETVADLLTIAVARLERAQAALEKSIEQR